MSAPLPPQYNPAETERALYQWWQSRGTWRHSPDDPREPYVIMMPPPNVTDRLHMGHGLNLTIQDTLARFERMRGRAVEWIPGTDHAGIATQNVVERLLGKEGTTRFDVGRDAFVERVRAYVRETGDTILQQIRALGASCDWSRTYYTFSDQLSRAVRETFVDWYRQDLIYRGKYIINWCPRCLTALSNEEAEKQETSGTIWRVRLPAETGLIDRGRHHATREPFSAIRVGVHPGQAVPEAREVGAGAAHRRLVPIVADDAVDREFGTGAVKLTPAHDPLDFEIAGRRSPGHRCAHAGSAHGGDGARAVPGAGSLRGPEARRGGARGRGPDRERGAAHPRRGPLLSLRHRRGAASLRSVVRPDATPRRAGARGLSRRQPLVCSGAMGHRL
jgi:valyl-tRNA synthetase